MNQEFVLGKLADLMDWGEDQARHEFAWLRLMSRMKYDGYQDFLAGMRFIESLADWLQQFRPQKWRPHTSLSDSSSFSSVLAEMRHLVELFYPETVQPRSDSEGCRARHPSVSRLGRRDCHTALRHTSSQDVVHRTERRGANRHFPPG